MFPFLEDGNQFDSFWRYLCAAYYLPSLFSLPLCFSCPSGQFEQCVLPNPFGGCSQKVCVPDGGSVTGGLIGPLSDLNKGVINLGNGVVNAPKSVSSSCKH